jgi:hypothetical protein
MNPSAEVAIRATKTQKRFVTIVFGWMLLALAFAVIESRLLPVIAVPIAMALWYAAHSMRLTQTTQLVMPILLLPGALMCFIGFMQSFGYGRMADEPATAASFARAAFFIVGIVLHFFAYWLMANESRASDHMSGEQASKI